MPTHRPSVGAQATALFVVFGVTYAAASVGALASVEAGSFYAAVIRPGWAPPGWLFGPVWSVLYTLMAIAAWLVWRSAGFPAATLPLSVFAAQLVANALWSWLFFAWRLGALAFADVLLLLALILATARVFWRVNRLAALLLAPSIG